VNWKNLLTHPSNLVRLDELLKKKQEHLNGLSGDFPGSTDLFKKINYDHRAMVYNMRNYIQIFSQFHFSHNISSWDEIVEMKKSFQEEERFQYKHSVNVSDLNNSELWCVLNSTMDFESTKIFYKNFLELFSWEYNRK